MAMQWARKRYLLFIFVDCCKVLRVASTGLAKEFQSSKLGVYEHVGYSNSKMYYKNENGYVLQYAPVGEWAIASMSSLGKNGAFVDSNCDSACPSTCKHWDTFNTTARKTGKPSLGKRCNFYYQMCRWVIIILALDGVKTHDTTPNNKRLFSM